MNLTDLGVHVYIYATSSYQFNVDQINTLLKYTPKLEYKPTITGLSGGHIYDFARSYT